MSGSIAIIQRIAGLQEDEAVKRCLKALFMHELEWADAVMPRYKAEYEKVISKHAASWSGADGREGAE